MRLTTCLVLALVLSLPPSGASAQPAPHCSPGATPAFAFGFADLDAQLGDVMGSPTSCEYADPNGSGDTLQDTSTGLAFWRKSTNTPTFTDGANHWGLTSAGLVAWSGASIDPPASALAPAPSPAPPASSPPAPPPPAAPPRPAAPPAAPSPAPAANPTCGAPTNPWGYTFCPGGPTISSPPANFCSVFACIPTFARQTNGYVIECSDGLFSHSGGVRGSCSGHGGNGRALHAPA